MPSAEQVIRESIEEAKQKEQMMQIRVLHKDGRDEHYTDVIKSVIVYDGEGDKILYITDAIMTYTIPLDATLFIHQW